MLILLSQNKIAGVSRLLAIALRRGESPEAINLHLKEAISGTYKLRSGWTDRDCDVAFLVKAIGGPQLLYVLQHADGYPSATTLNRRKKIPDIAVSPGIPNATEIDMNIQAFLGPKPPPKIKKQVVVIDGVALEEIGCLDLKQNCIIGLCREHSGVIKKTVDSLADIEAAVAAVHNAQTAHYGKDGTVLGICPVTDDESYYVVPLVLSSSCKTETGDQLAEWIEEFLERYHSHALGQLKHGEIIVVATDGESSFRKMRFKLFLIEDLDPDSALGKILYNLPGMNCRTGRHQVHGTCDPKHILKRFATLLRSPGGIQVGKLTCTPPHVLNALTTLDDMTDEKAATLLDPADKQNVPKAVNLLQNLYDLFPEKLEVMTHIKERLRTVHFIGKVFNYFMRPFTVVEMTSSQQLWSLSTYSHLITALWKQHKLSFLTGALYADSQAIVKNIYFTTAELQLESPLYEYYILFEGTDCMEGVFSNVRTQDHAPNFDILQLAHKLSIATEINAIFERHPDLNRGHIRRSLSNVRGVDHTNPKSWIGDVTVGNIKIEQEYKGGRDDANKLLKEYLGSGAQINFDIMFN